jgi:glycerol-1-phosphate dehydrogenase [NAD(P)+]
MVEIDFRRTNMELPYDPGQGEHFWTAISQIPGYPAGEVMPIREMIFGSEALFQLPQILERLGADKEVPVLVVMDETIMLRTGEQLKPLLLRMLQNAGWTPEPLIMAPDITGQVHTEMPRAQEVRRQIRPGMAVLSVGSGTITDIAKHGCYLFEQETGLGVPFIVFQTANSVSAYTSNMAPIFIEGVKRTMPSRYPDALVCDLETLCDAPADMTAAGVGDLLAIYVSLPDWYLAYRLGMDQGYSVLAQTLMGPLDEIFLSQAQAIRGRSLEGMAVLAKLIALGGLAMSLSHATTPMSGFEHVMSHILDLQAEFSGKPLAQHGTQVALAAMLASDVYGHFLDEFEPEEINLDSCYPSTAMMEELITRTFANIDPSGKAGAECWSDYRLKLEAWHRHRKDFEAFLKDWPEIRTQISDMTRPSKRLVEILRSISSPLRFSELAPPAAEAQVKFAFLYAPLMRKRLTIGDLLVFTHWDREKLWRQIWH